MTISTILEEIRDICSGNSNTTNLDNTTLLRRINIAYEEIISIIANVDGRWQFDDANFATFPIGTTTLVNSQNDYAFASDVLEVEQVSVLDSDGNWHLLTPIDREQMGVDPVEFEENDGLPNWYDKQGNSLLLYPAPSSANVTLTNGLKVTFKRTADIYTVPQLTTGTKEPGFASSFHMLLPLKSSVNYLMVHTPERLPVIYKEIDRLEKGLKQHYGRREQDRRKQLSMAGVSHR